MDSTEKAVAIIRAARRGQRHAAQGPQGDRGLSDGREGEVRGIKKGRGTNCMLEEENWIMKRVRE